MFWPAIVEDGVEALVHHDGFCIVKTCLFPIHLHQANPIHSSDSSSHSPAELPTDEVASLVPCHPDGCDWPLEAGGVGCARAWYFFGAGSLPKSRCCRHSIPKSCYLATHKKYGSLAPSRSLSVRGYNSLLNAHKSSGWFGSQLCHGDPAAG